MSSSGSSSSNVGVGFDLLANNNRGTHLDRAVPMEVANSRTSIPLLSPSPTGGIRTTPSPASGGLQADSAEILAAANAKSICSSTASTTISSSATGTSQSGAGGLVSSSGELSSTYSSCSSASSPSPSFLLIHQQQQPHLFTSSSAALSPKSLTSSTPSPVTVHDFNSGLNVVVGSSSNNNLTATSSNGSAANVMLTTRKCATPSPISLTPRPLLSPFGSPFSPTPSNNNNNGNYKDLVWKHEDGGAKINKPIPINGHCDQQSSAGSSLTTTPTSSPLLHRRSKQLSVPTPLSSPNSQKHDFRRLESLIERRDSESISPLVLVPQHSPATSTTSSMLDGEEIRSILHGDGGDCEQKHVNPAFILLKDEVDRESKGNDGEEEEDVSGMEKVGTAITKEIDSNREEEDSTHSTTAAVAAAASENNSGNDLFKVKARHDDETKGGLVKAEKVLGGESQSCGMMMKSEVVANKNVSKISSCDVNKLNMMMDNLPSENQHDGHADEDDNVDDKIERNVVPESTLPFSSSCNSSSYDNNDIARFNYVKNEISGSSTTTTTIANEKQSEKKQQQSMSIKHDISFTSGYSSSNDDAEGGGNTAKPKAPVKAKLKNNKKEGSPSKGKKKLSPSLKIKGKKIKDPASGNNKKATKKAEGGGKGKPLKSIKSPLDKASTKTGKPKKGKLKEKPLADWNGEDEKPEKKKNKSRKKIKSILENSNQPGGTVGQLVNDSSVLLSSSSSPSSNNSIKRKDKGRKDNGKLSLKTQGKKKEQGNKTSSLVKKNPVNAVTHVSSHDKRKNKKGDKGGDDAKLEKNGRLMKTATLSKKKLGVKGDSKSKANKKSHLLLSPPPPPPQQEYCSKMSTVARSQHFGANVSGDISGNGNNGKSITDDQNNSLTISASLDSIVSSPLTSDTIYQQQPVALILQSSSSLQQQTTTLRIPAYVPRSSGSSTIIGSSESLSSVMTDELVGDQDNYSGPATLTLHCDVDALQQQQQIYYPQESHIPPAITIQYHHSAPATPMMPLMEATSPLIKPEENSLNLLATVAQEFGSREDLGKRLSIDGSCNNSIIGESPPMSPIRSPGYSVTLQQAQNQQQPQRENKSYQSCSAPTAADNSSKGIISDVVREVVDLYHNDRASLNDKLKSQKKNELKGNKKPRKNGEKTSNSIIAKRSKGPKAGKKEKRSISDCGSYAQNLVLLKIPQLQQRPIPSDKSKLEKAKRKSEKKGEKAKEKKSAKLSPLLLPSTTTTDNQKKVKREKSPEKEKVKNVKKKTTSEEEKRSPTSLLKPERLSKSPGASSSSSCFYTPPERISAFAKQVIARRDSAVGTGSAPSSPTKSPAGNIHPNNNPSSPSKASTTFSQDFFPAMKHQQLISPTGQHPHSSASSPSVKMPLLTPFDLEQHHEVSKETPFTFSLAVPPPLVPSISSGSRIPGLHPHHHHSTKIPEQDKEKTDMLAEGSPSCSNSSSTRNIISSKDMVKVKRTKRDKTNPFDDEKGQQPQKKTKKRKHDLPSGEDETVARQPVTKKKSKKSESILSSISPPRTVPKITITSIGKESLSRQYPFSNDGIQNSTTFRAFSPLTPPPTAKFPVDHHHDNGNHGRGMRDLPSLNAKNSTPSSSHLSSPSNLENEEQGDAETTENENENDPNNIWVADPMFAVSAIKLSTSNQPSDTSSIGEDVSSLDEIDEIERRNQKHKRKSSKSGIGGGNDNKPPKLSLYNKNSCQEDSKNQGKDRFLEVKSQLKSFVHFKPKQLKSNQKGQSHIKPCLKAEPVVRSHTGNEEEDDEDEEVRVDDEDFELDLEVANITTPNPPPKDGNKAKQPSSATSAISGSGKKQSINRNRLSYSSKKHPSSGAPLSTKEIMTKVFSRKLSPELGGGRKKQRHQSSSSSKKLRRASEVGVTANANDDDEDELLDIDEPTPTIKHNYQQHHSAHVSMCAAAAAVIVQSNATSSTGSPSLTSSSQTTFATASSSPNKKIPKKRSARSSTTSSSASTKSSGRGYRGQSAFTTAFANAVAGASQERDETTSPGKVELGSVDELVDEMRILTEIQGLFYTGRLNALQPPDVYGVTLDNERGAPPHLIFSAEEVLEKCLREKKPSTLTSGLRICAYWSPQYSGLYPGRVSTTDFNPKFDPEEDLIPIEFDDGDTGMIKLKEIRLLSTNHPIREYDPNPLLTLEKKHRKRRHSSATGTSGGCTGDHEEPDCGEPYCAKIGKLQDEEDDDDDDEDDDHPTVGRGGGGHSKMLYWTWSGLGYKRPKNKKNKNKEFFHGIQRGDEVLNVGDAALFISTGNERPFIGRVERFWECKGKKMVNVRWFYHPEEVKASAKRLSNLKYPGALFESPHIDENDVQTIAKKCDVLPFPEFKQRICTTSSGSPRLAKLTMKPSSSKPRDMYYVAGFYDPYTYNLKIKDLK